MIVAYAVIVLGVVLAYVSVIRPVARNARRNFGELTDAIVPTLVIAGVTVLFGACGSIIALGVIHR